MHDHDIIHITGLICKTLIGIYPHERQALRLVSLDLALETNIQKAAKEDDIQFAVDYEKIINTLKETLPTYRFQLLEALSVQIIKDIFTIFDNIFAIKITITKLNLFEDCGPVGITIRRKRHEC